MNQTNRFIISISVVAVASIASIVSVVNLGGDSSIENVVCNCQFSEYFCRYLKEWCG